MDSRLRQPESLARGGVPSATLATLRPLAAGSARRDFFLAPQAASSTPPHRLGPPVAGAASRRRGGAVRPASRGPLPKRPCTERVDAPLPARRPTEAYPLRYGEGGQRSRSGCSGPRMPGSEGMAPGRPERSRAGPPHGEPRTEPPSEAAEPISASGMAASG